MKPSLHALFASEERSYLRFNSSSFIVPEGVEDHSEEDEFTEKRYHERRRRDDLGQQEEEHSQ